MAFPTKSPVSFFLLLCFTFLLVMLLLQSSAGCNDPTNCLNVKDVLRQEKHRKMVVYHLGKNKVGFNHGGASEGEIADGWELREAPMGPDPLHHHGGGTKKPWTP